MFSMEETKTKEVNKGDHEHNQRDNNAFFLPRRFFGFFSNIGL